MARLPSIASLSRPLAIAAVVGTVLFTGTAPSQTISDGSPPAATGEREPLEQRLTTLKAALKITPDQESKWNAVAQTMRDNASRMDKLIAAKSAVPTSKTTVVDDLRSYREIAELHLDGLKNLTSAFELLYESMTPEQKENTDRVFERLIPSREGEQG